MIKDLKVFLWLLKLGAGINIYFFAQTLIPPLNSINNNILIPAQILFSVSAYRCLFPNRYTNNAVLNYTILSSIFFTRFLATISEIAYIFLFSLVIRLLNYNQIEWIYILSWLMVIQVTISQFFVWGGRY